MRRRDSGETELAPRAEVVERVQAFRSEALADAADRVNEGR